LSIKQFNKTMMEKFRIIEGFASIYDIDRLDVDIDDFLACQDEYINFLKERNLKGLVLYSRTEKKIVRDLSFLEKLSFLETFECIVPLGRKSNIEGLYFLQNLVYLRWVVKNPFPLDFSKLTNIEVLYTSDYGGMINWSSLINLKELSIGNLKMEDCSFVSGLAELTDLKLPRANITSIKGIEKCKNLKRLELIFCYKISEVSSVLKECIALSLEFVSLKHCKYIGKEELVKIEELGLRLWVE